MPFENSIKALQVAAAALGIPAAAAGTYSAYQTFFSNDATCQKLRTEILATMERNVPVESKHTLLRRDVAEFHKTCGKSDPEATSIFQAALRATEQPTAAATAPAAQNAAAVAPAHADPSPNKATTHIGLFGGSGPGEQQGWVAISRRDSSTSPWVLNFTGYAISETSLPPAGTILTAQRLLPVWSEMQIGPNDDSKLRSRLPKGACVRVIGARGIGNRLWAEIAPAACS
jgi:hypothetical protein